MNYGWFVRPVWAPNKLYSYDYGIWRITSSFSSGQYLLVVCILPLNRHCFLCCLLLPSTSHSLLSMLHGTTHTDAQYIRRWNIIPGAAPIFIRSVVDYDFSFLRISPIFFFFAFMHILIRSRVHARVRNNVLSLPHRQIPFASSFTLRPITATSKRFSNWYENKQHSTWIRPHRHIDVGRRGADSTQQRIYSMSNWLSFSGGL